MDKEIRKGDLTMWYCLTIKQGLCRKFTKLNTDPYRFIKKLGKVNYKNQQLSYSSKVKVVHAYELR